MILWFTVFDRFLWRIICSSIDCVCSRSQHILLIVLVINYRLIWFKILAYSCIYSLSTYFVAAWCFHFNHIFNFVRVITSTYSSLSILIFLTAWLTIIYFVWRYTILSPLRLTCWRCFWWTTSSYNTHTVFL